MAKILIVDDQESFLVTLEKILADQKHSTKRANNAFDAIELLKAEYFDVLITDAIMPGHTGYDLATTVRKIPVLKTLPIIMLTGKKALKDVQKGIQAGVNDYVFKPVEPKILLSKLNNILIKNKLILPELTKIPVSFKASWQDETAIIELSEVGLLISSNIALPVGTTMDLSSDFYEDVGIYNLALTVMECIPDKTRKEFFKIKALFVSPTEADIKAIRTWISSKVNSKAA